MMNKLDGICRSVNELKREVSSYTNLQMPCKKNFFQSEGENNFWYFSRSIFTHLVRLAR